MSQYFIAGYNNNHLITVGWDRPMRTFFASVIDAVVQENDKEEEEYVLLWLGTKYDECKDINDLKVSLAEYAIIPNDIIMQCQQDAKIPFSSAPLQQSIEDLFNSP